MCDRAPWRARSCSCCAPPWPERGSRCRETRSSLRYSTSMPTPLACPPEHPWRVAYEAGKRLGEEAEDELVSVLSITEE